MGTSYSSFDFNSDYNSDYNNFDNNVPKKESNFAYYGQDKKAVENDVDKVNTKYVLSKKDIIHLLL